MTETYTTYENTKKQQRKKSCKIKDRVSHDDDDELSAAEGKTFEGSSLVIGVAETAGVGGIE